MAGAEQRAALIASAEELFHRQGYVGTGAREIAMAAGVPQGSFTNHFRSKEALGIAALDRYVARLGEMMDATLADRTRPAKERLLDYFHLVGGKISEAGWRRGCLVADLAADVSSHGDVLRMRLAEVMAAQVAAFGSVLVEAADERDREDLAAFIVAAWHGTLLRIKVERGPEPLHGFLRVVEGLLERSEAK